MQKYNWKKILIIGLIASIIILMALTYLTKPSSPSLPLASPLPPVPQPQDQLSSIKKFNWQVTNFPEIEGELFLYKIVSPFASPVRLNNLANTLGFGEADVDFNEINQKNWSNKNGSLAISASPQYVQFSSPDTSGITINIEQIKNILANDNLVLEEPSTSTQQIRSLESSKIDTVNLAIYPVSQKIDSLPIVSQDSVTLGSLVVNQESGGLVSITVSGGYHELNKEGSVIPLTFEQVKNTAEKSAIKVNSVENISERKRYLSTEQQVSINAIEIVYYNDPNTYDIVPGFLVSGKNQENEAVSYFVPML